MIEKVIEKALDSLEERIKPMISEAYRNGYEDATSDVCRRLEEIYSFAFEIAKTDALAEAGMIELDDDVAEALGE